MAAATPVPVAEFVTAFLDVDPDVAFSSMCQSILVQALEHDPPVTVQVTSFLQDPTAPGVRGLAYMDADGKLLLGIVMFMTLTCSMRRNTNRPGPAATAASELAHALFHGSDWDKLGLTADMRAFISLYGTKASKQYWKKCFSAMVAARTAPNHTVAAVPATAVAAVAAVATAAAGPTAGPARSSCTRRGVGEPTETVVAVDAEDRAGADAGA